MLNFILLAIWLIDKGSRCVGPPTERKVGLDVQKHLATQHQLWRGITNLARCLH